MKPNEQLLHEFKESVWDYYHQYGRDLPWRHPDKNGAFDAYPILVSEIMLQQTQVNRVIPKFEQFIEQFPSIQDLAKASLGEVLTAWSGLGYNRRAKFVWESAKVITEQYDGKFPNTIHDLTKLPGIGHNTAAAVLTYAYNQPIVFIETNIRTVCIYHFFNNEDRVSDKELLPLIDVTLDRDNPREWFWALMDYGSFLKRAIGNISKQSSHYQKQSKFEGSLRQIRGRVLRLLIERSRTEAELQACIPDERLLKVLGDLIREGLIQKQGQYISLL